MPVTIGEKCHNHRSGQMAGVAVAFGIIPSPSTNVSGATRVTTQNPTQSQHTPQSDMPRPVVRLQNVGVAGRGGQCATANSRKAMSSWQLCQWQRGAQRGVHELENQGNKQSQQVPRSGEIPTQPENIARDAGNSREAGQDVTLRVAASRGDLGKLAWHGHTRGPVTGSKSSFLPRRRLR